jgi:hypothetical protein
MRLNRVDLALDYEAPLEEVLQGLDVGQKRIRIAYLDEGATRTGMTIGKGTETIIVYDKARESKLAQPRTRIEIQLKGAKLPTRTLDELPHRLAYSPRTLSYFASISISRVVVADAAKELTEAQVDRRAEVLSILKREGLLSAKRSLNVNGNFIRDYGSFIQIIPVSEQPNEAFQRLIPPFFDGPPFMEDTKSL